MKSRRAEVRLDGQRVGLLLEHGPEVSFQYSADWLAKPVL